MTVMKTLETKGGQSNSLVTIQDQAAMFADTHSGQIEGHLLDIVMVKSDMGHVLSKEESSVVTYYLYML